MPSSPMRILLMGEGSTLAHVGRPLLLARALHQLGHDVVLARPQAYAWMTADAPFRVMDLETQPPTEFAQRLDSGKPLYTFKTLQQYVEDDRKLIQEVRPGAIIGDFRLSLSVSARLERLPYATICDAYWSPETPLAPILPVFPWTQFAPLGLSQALFRHVAPLAFRIHARPMERLRRSYGLPGFEGDLRKCYTDADLRLFANPPPLFPDVHPHSGALFIGPLAWSPDSAKFSAPPADGRPLVYVTMGSSGSPSALSALVPALEHFDCNIVISTAGRTLASELKSSRAYIADYLPGDLMCAMADLVVCNGGSPTTNQALANGVPVLGIPRNMDQFLNMRAIEAFGAGLTIRADRSSAKLVTPAVDRLLHHPGYREQAGRIRTSCSRSNLSDILPVILNTLDLVH